MIEIQGVTKKFGEFTALSHIDLTIKKGTTVILIGPSGCGKSTLIRLINGLLSTDAGVIKVKNTVVTNESVQNIRHQIGYVIQQGGLFPHLTAYQNCTLLSDYKGWNTDKNNRRLKELCALTKLNVNELHKYPHEFSGGQNQRISLMRALMLDPEILLLDEPLASIDPLVRYELQEDLKEIFSTLKKTVLIVTHDLNEAAFLANDIVLMNKGRIIQRGTVNDLISNPNNEFVTKFINAQRTQIGAK